jgi:5-methylcytosine-specific restriction protein B
VLEPRLFKEIMSSLERYVASGKSMTATQIRQQTDLFRDRFGPTVLRQTDGEALLKLMHGRDDPEHRCLMYWLEFKNDEEFAGHSFGGIGGGQALKYGIYQRQSDHEWMGGSPTAPRVLPIDEAVAIARRQRDELLDGDAVLATLDPNDTSDEAYARVQAAMEKAAPELSDGGWAHKYWFLCHPDRLDDFHSPRWQRFHLIKLLQMPPDGVGILDGSAPRFICAGRFLTAARELGVPVDTLDGVLNERHGALHRYWKVGTTAGSTGDSQWAAMRDGGYVSIGWPEQIPDLSSGIGGDRASTKAQLRDWLLPLYPTNPGVATRKAGEILNFADVMAENDIVVACEGQNVLGVGRIRAPYQYDGTLAFPHKRPVEWLLLEPWQMIEPEGPRTTVFQLGRSAANLLDIEQHLSRRDAAATPLHARGPSTIAPGGLPALDPLAARVETILLRKGQIILYGPPGTGKTYHALRIASELAARRRFGKTFQFLSEAERAEVEGTDGLVRLCTFHPGFGYEDFMEGLRPQTTPNGQMVFVPTDGIFKHLCTLATNEPSRSFFLVVDEINRGDVPRIFGELITVIEYDKRRKLITLPVTRATFAVPENVFLLGTMNTADRSISLLDTALRRRFGFVELMPDISRLAGKKAGDLPLGAWLEALNTRIRQHLKRDSRNLQIGHAYLLRVNSAAEFIRIVRDEIIPLLEEYCYDDFETLKNILNIDLIDPKMSRVKNEMFEPNREADLIEALRFAEMQPVELAQLAAGEIAMDGTDAEENGMAEDDDPSSAAT